MQKRIAANARAILLGLALLCAVSVPPAAAQDESGVVRTADDSWAEAWEAEINEAHKRFDRYARTLSRKKRSELINLKSYTDEEWAQHERDVKANNAACRKRDAAACLAAGRAYESGDGVWIVPDIAFILYGEACELGLGEGCRAFYDLAHSGWGYPEGGVMAADGMLEKGCERGDLVACESVAAALRETDRARSDAILGAACTAGGMAACHTLASYLLASEASADIARGRAILAAACTTGEGDACAALGNHLAAQPGHDRAEVSRYRQRACAAGNADACNELGARAWSGADGAPDRALAADYLAKACAIEDHRCDVSDAVTALPVLEAACAARDRAGCTALGRALLVLGSPAHDAERASALLVAACRNGGSDACADAASAIAMHDRTGPAIIRELRETGCAAQDARACFDLAQSLNRNPGDPDFERAAMLYRQLCEAQHAEACEAEAGYAGLAEAARIMPAGENFTPPLPRADGGNLLTATEIMEVCFSGSERFRGKTYEHFACDRGEKGIGSDRARPGQAPWQALLWRPAEMFGITLSPAQRVKCGGSLIAQGWIVTAAHCLKDEGIDLTDPAARAGYRVRLGVYNPANDEGISYPITRVIPHPQFNPQGRYEFDIALVQYDTAAAHPGTERAFANPVRTITLDPLPIGNRRIIAGTPVYAFGWGWTAVQKSAATDYLQIVEMKLSSDKACAAATGFAKAFVTAAVCAKGPNNEQTCFGDSGGPLVHYSEPGGRPVLIGVVSAGEACGTGPTKRPSQYTRIAAVREWIAAHVPGVR